MWTHHARLFIWYFQTLSLPRDIDFHLIWLTKSIFWRTLFSFRSNSDKTYFIKRHRWVLTSAGDQSIVVIRRKQWKFMTIQSSNAISFDPEQHEIMISRIADLKCFPPVYSQFIIVRICLPEDNTYDGHWRITVAAGQKKYNRRYQVLSGWAFAANAISSLTLPTMSEYHVQELNWTPEVKQPARKCFLLSTLKFVGIFVIFNPKIVLR